MAQYNDSFTDADNTGLLSHTPDVGAGGPWTGTLSAPFIQYNILQQANNGPGYAHFPIAAGDVVNYAQHHVYYIGSIYADAAILALRLTDENNLVGCRIVHTVLQFVEINSGTFNVPAQDTSGTWGYGPSDVKMAVDGSDNFTVYVDGALKISYTDSFNNTEPNVGIASVQATTADVEWGSFIVDYTAGGGGGATTNTVQASIDAALEILRTQSASLDAELQKAGLTAAASLDAYLSKEASVQANLDAALQRTGITRSASLDAALQALRTQSATLDAALLKAGITAGASMDAYLATQYAVGSSLDAALQKRITGQASMDAMLQMARQVSADLDAAIARAITAGASADAILQAVRAVAFNVDAVLRATITVGASLDAYLTAPGVTPGSVTASLDAMLQASRQAVTDLDAILQRAGVTVSSSMDGVMSKLRTATAAMDAVLQPITTVQALMDAMLQVAGRTASAALDAILNTPIVDLTHLVNVYLDTRVPAAYLDTLTPGAYLAGDVDVFLAK